MTDDPYIKLEDTDGEKGIHFALAANKMCLKALGDPTTNPKSTSYSRILNALDSDEKIPFVSKMGTDSDGNEILFNFWRDSKNPKGIWRKTTMKSYETSNPDWKTVLDLDELSKQEKTSWIWRGSRILPVGRDAPMDKNKNKTKNSSYQGATRALISLSKEDSYEVVTREFDLVTSSFVETNAFNLPESTTSICYKSRDVVLVGTNAGPRSLTKAGYPRIIREWQRGTNLSTAPIVFEGEHSDVAVSAHIDDQSIRGGGIYEIVSRALSHTESRYWVRKVKYNHLLAADNPLRAGLGEPSRFKEVQAPKDAEISFIGNLLMITLRSSWSPEAGKTFARGSIVYVNAHKFIKYGMKDRIYHVLFRPSAQLSCEYVVYTKNFVILSQLENLKSTLVFYKLEKEGNKLRMVGTEKSPQIRQVQIRAVDANKSDEFWLTTSSYTENTTLYLADAANMDTGDKKIIRKTGSEGYLKKTLKSLPEYFDSKDTEVIQRICKSKDGTEIPYFMVKRKGIMFDKSNCTLLYGYGGFEVSLGPQYLGPTGIAWLEKGGVYVEANIRGGGEFGSAWHKAATRENRMRAYEDFISVAEDLISAKICKAKTLAIRGGANGGLLVANAYLMRPELFGAVHCAFPVLDLKRLKRMQRDENWVSELGDPDTNDWEKFMKKISPYHNVNEAVRKYPPILFTGSRETNIIPPGHARKMVKMLWEKGQGKKWPTYYYEIVEKQGSDSKQHAFVTALAYEFLYSTLSKKSRAHSK